jgi:AP-3 complex subunit mu
MQSLFICTEVGEIVIEKHYRGVVPRSVVDQFFEAARACNSLKELPPVVATPRGYVISVLEHETFFLATLPNEYAPLLVIEFLDRVIDIFNSYFGDCRADTLRENFVTVYQLLDEMMDNGFPLSTEPNILIELVAPPSKDAFQRMEKGLNNLLSPKGSSMVELPTGVASNVPWRKVGVKHTNNEIFFDIEEQIDAIVDNRGLTVQSDVHGSVNVNCLLSGMPDLTLSFINPSVLDDCSFHRCVRYSRFEREKVLSFVPPDGKFQLFSFRSASPVDLPLYVQPQCNWTDGVGRLNVSVGTRQLGRGSKGLEDVKIMIAIPADVSTGSFTASSGSSATYDEATKVCTWNIGKLNDKKVATLAGTLSQLQRSPQRQSGESHPVFSVKFTMSGVAISGLKVDTLTLTGEPYKPFKGVRLRTTAGKFEVRL